MNSDNIFENANTIVLKEQKVGKKYQYILLKPLQQNMDLHFYYITVKTMFYFFQIQN